MQAMISRKRLLAKWKSILNFSLSFSLLTDHKKPEDWLRYQVMAGKSPYFLTPASSGEIEESNSNALTMGEGSGSAKINNPCKPKDIWGRERRSTHERPF